MGFDIISSIIGGVVVILIVRVCNVTIPFLNRKRIYDFLPIAKGSSAIVLGTQSGFKAYNTTDTWVHSEVIKGIDCLTKFLLLHGVKPEIRLDSKFSDQDSFSLEICFGGPLANSRTNWVLSTYCSYPKGNSEYRLSPNEGTIIRVPVHDTVTKCTKVFLLIYGYRTHETIGVLEYFIANYKSLFYKSGCFSKNEIGTFLVKIHEGGRASDSVSKQ